MLKIENNLSRLDILLSDIAYIIDWFKILLEFRKTYKNSFQVTINFLKKQYPINAILKNGKHLVLENYSSTIFVSQIQNYVGVDYDVEKDEVIVTSFPWKPKNEMKVKLIGSINDGDLITVLLEQEYRVLPVEGKTVIDIGANIGDSIIYFAMQGADKIIGLEPFPKTYHIAKKNVEQNGLSNKVTMLLAGCSEKSSHILVDPEKGGVGASITETCSKVGEMVPLLTLKQIIDEYDVPEGAVLKVDCEGCEYESIMEAPEEILTKFSDIMIEYHYGYKNLKERLEKIGFKVLVITRPKTNGIFSKLLYLIKNSKYRNNEEPQVFYSGLILASRNYI